VSGDFVDPANTYFLPDQLADFDPEKRTGHLRWTRSRYGAAMNFNNMGARFEPVKANEWPTTIYAADPELPFSIEFVSATTLRIRMQSSATAKPKSASLMLVREPVDDHSWQGGPVEGGYEYKSAAGSVIIRQKPWVIEIRDASGKLLTETVTSRDDPPFCFVRRSSDYSRSFSATFSLAVGEKIFGGGESFTRMDKRGQKLVLYTHDALGVERPQMYKPVPFLLSNRGYGMFIHSSSPMTGDIGCSNTSRNAVMVGDDELDLFIFLGKPKEVIDAYTDLTGKAPLPPLWSFGLWMSRITYKSEPEVRDVAAKLRANRIPSDVIHLDTGWFETDWLCDYQFSTSRFSNPQKMIDDLKGDGFHVSLWQLPYFVPKNRLFPEILSEGLAVRDAKGNVPFEDAILDFSNPKTVTWYQKNIGGLLRMGVGAIKTDFGEAAPPDGLYASGGTGFYEHNLYPLRYQKAVAEVTREVTGENIIWARAGWAGSQRYPVHWGGDAGKTLPAMAATLRGGLSLGVCGFSFWSHDIGGFAGRTDVEVYRNWTPFGMLTSHSRVHGEPPKEPWTFDEKFLNEFRLADEMRYKLMPYIFAQAKECSEQGLPMLRALWIEYPEDAGSWEVEDEYLFGSSILVAPLFEKNATGRDVYLPPGKWTDYQSAKIYAGGWQHIDAGAIPVIMLVRAGTIIPQIALAQSTRDMDWMKLTLLTVPDDAGEAKGVVFLPTGGPIRKIAATRKGAGFALTNDPFAGKVSWTVTTLGSKE
ncbi:MAG: alpha-D-xyloside xylohydrolase, partial [Chthoniobacter sp.]|nr:alpha-D-xyloside xylohydrolase [Chthoniobacter sp.]